MMDKAPDAYRTITEVAEDLDLPQHVLRFWETRFGQIKPLKRGGGRRYYRPDDVDLLRGIRALLYRDGFTIKGVQRILREQGIKAVQAIGRATLPGGEGEAAAGGLEAAAYGAPTQEALAQKPRFVDSGPEDRGDFDVDDGEDFPADADVSIPPPMPVVPRREAPAPPAGRIHAPIPRPEPAAPAGAASQAVPALPVAPAISEALTWPAVPAESGEDDGDAPALPAAAPVRPEPPPAIARRTPERGETPDLFGYSSSGPAAPGPAGVGQVSIVRGGLPRKPIVLAPASPDPLSAGSQAPDPQFPDDSPHPASLSHEEEVPAPVERRGAEAGAWQADRPDLRAEINALAGAFRDVLARYRVFAPPAEG